MSTITPTDPGLTASIANVKQTQWAMGIADVGTAVAVANFPDKTITATGTWGGATLVVEGSNDNVTFITMADPQGNSLSKTSNFIEAILENPLYVRVSTSGGSGTALTVILTSRTSS